MESMRSWTCCRPWVAGPRSSPDRVGRRRHEQRSSVITSRGRAIRRGADARRRASCRRRDRDRPRSRRARRRISAAPRRRSATGSPAGVVVLPTPPGNKLSPVNRCGCPRVAIQQRRRARRVPAQRDDVQRQVADGYGVAVRETLVDRDGQASASARRHMSRRRPRQHGLRAPASGLDGDGWSGSPTPAAPRTVTSSRIRAPRRRRR